MESFEKIQAIIIITYLIILIIILLVAFSFYNDYVELKKREENNNISSGMWNVGKFQMNLEVLLPINDKTENQNLKIIINRHKKSLTVFWIWFFIIIPIIIILNYIS